MNISEYARERGTQPQTISRYITRHPEISKLLIPTQGGRGKELTQEAIQLLDLKYPPRLQPRFVSLEQYQQALETINQQSLQIIQLQNEIIRLQNTRAI